MTSTQCGGQGANALALCLGSLANHCIKCTGLDDQVKSLGLRRRHGGAVLERVASIMCRSQGRPKSRGCGNCVCQRLKHHRPMPARCIRAIAAQPQRGCGERESRVIGQREAAGWCERLIGRVGQQTGRTLQKRRDLSGACRLGLELPQGDEVVEFACHWPGRSGVAGQSPDPPARVWAA